MMAPVRLSIRHCRRKFHEALEVIPKDLRKQSVLYLIMNQIRAIYREEGKLSGLSSDGLPIDFYIINSADPFRFLQRSVLIHVIPFSTDLLPASLHFAVFVQIILCVFYGGLHIHIRRGIARTTAATAEVPRNNSFFLTLFMGCK